MNTTGSAMDAIDKLLGDWAALERERAARALEPFERRRLSLLQDMLLEAGAMLSSRHTPYPKRGPRVPLRLSVTYRSREGAGRGVTRDVSATGACIETDRPFERGSVLALTLAVPGWQTTLSTAGEVVWSRPGEMGVALRVLRSEDEDRLRDLVASRAQLAEELRRWVRSAEQLAAQKDETRPRVVLAVGEPQLSDALVALFSVEGLELVQAAPYGPQPRVVVSDIAHAVVLSHRFPDAGLVLVNASGIDVLNGALGALNIAAYVKRPSTASAVLNAVRGVLVRPQRTRD